MAIKLVELDTVLTFGAHKGKTVRAVLGTNPSYIRWAFNTLEWFNLSLEVSAALKAAMGSKSYTEKYPSGASVMLSGSKHARARKSKLYKQDVVSISYR